MSAPDSSAESHVDVLIVGAGLSGVGAAYHLQENCPERTYVILEGRERMGGTWDLFRYPGIRSDSDMYTLGYKFRPWTDPKAIADGPAILQYIQDTARSAGIDRRVRYGHRVRRASWSSEHAHWTVEATLEDGTSRKFTCNFLMLCSGYYEYAEGYTPDWPNLDQFEGQVIHPQHWPEGLDYAGKRIVVIGSGATAVTLVPNLARTAAHVTMLQRSPTYVISRPANDAIADRLRARLPRRAAYALARGKNILLGMLFYRYCQRHPDKAAAWLLEGVQAALGPDYDVERDFRPRYDPWDQRICLVPDGDLFEVIRSGKASVVTDHIEAFTAEGIRLRSGDELRADIIVTATGLKLQVFGGIELEVDGHTMDPATLTVYKGALYSDVPNLAVCMGYTNASWTLKCDLTCEYVCRLLNYMSAHGYTQACPRRGDPNMPTEAAMQLTSGYVQRAIHRFPKQGKRLPWRLYQNYALDMYLLKWTRLADGTLEFR